MKDAIAIDNGSTWVDGEEVEAAKHLKFWRDRSRKERKAGVTREEKCEHFIQVRLKSGSVIEGLFLGMGYNGDYSATLIMNQLVGLDIFGGNIA